MAHVLVVDDAKFSRGRIVAALKSAGHSCSEGANGRAALELLETNPPDLIITDLLMPELDGFGLLSELQRRNGSIPVIVVSADIQSSSQALCRDYGACAFLNKPFKPEDLLAAVDAAQTPTVKECAAC